MMKAGSIAPIPHLLPSPIVVNGRPASVSIISPLGIVDSAIRSSGLTGISMVLRVLFLPRPLCATNLSRPFASC